MSGKRPKGWIQTTLGAIVAPSRARVLPATVPSMRYVGLEHVEPHTMRLLGNEHAKNVRSSSLRFSRGDVLYGKMRPYLNKVWLAEFDGLCSGEFLVFPKTEGLNSQFLAARLNAPDFVAFAENHASGERPRVDFEKLAPFPIELPPLAEQNRIVAKLNTALRRIASGEKAADRAYERVRRYRAAVLTAGCEGRLVPTEAALARRSTPSVKFETAENLLNRALTRRRAAWGGRSGYKEPAAPLPVEVPLPKGWTWASPDQLSTFGDSAISAGPYGTIFKAKDFRPEGIPIIFLRHIAPGRYHTDDPRYMDAAKWNEIFRPYSVFGGELLVTKLGDPPGVCAIYPHDIGPAMVTPDVIKFSVNDAVALPEFLMHYFNSDIARRFSTDVAFGTTRLRLTLSLFRRMPVALPPLAEQERIVGEIDRRLAAADQLSSTLREQRLRTRATREALLQQAFSGMLVEQDPNEAPVSLQPKQHLAIKEPIVRTPRAKPMRKSKLQSVSQRRPLIEVLHEHDEPMTPEELFQRAGFEPAQADLFYRELTLLRESLEEEKPRGAAAKRWPHDAHVLLRLKRTGTT